MSDREVVEEQQNHEDTEECPNEGNAEEQQEDSAEGQQENGAEGQENGVEDKAEDGENGKRADEDEGEHDTAIKTEELNFCVAADVEVEAAAVDDEINFRRQEHADEVSAVEQPTEDEEQKEKKRVLRESIQNFNRKSLHETETQEKFIPPKQAIARDRVQDLIKIFDQKSQLKHQPEPKVKHTVQIELDK